MSDEPDEIYSSYAAQHGPMVTLKHADRMVPGLPQRLRALAARRGVPFTHKTGPSRDYEQRMARMTARGLIVAPGAEPFQPNIAKANAREFLNNLSAIASGKLT